MRITDGPIRENSLGAMRFYAEVGEDVNTCIVFVFKGIQYEIIGGKSTIHDQVTQEPELVTFVAVEVGWFVSSVTTM